MVLGCSWEEQIDSDFTCYSLNHTVWQSTRVFWLEKRKQRKPACCWEYLITMPCAREIQKHQIFYFPPIFITVPIILIICHLEKMLITYHCPTQQSKFHPTEKGTELTVAVDFYGTYLHHFWILICCKRVDDDLNTDAEVWLPSAWNLHLNVRERGLC